MDSKPEEKKDPEKSRKLYNFTCRCGWLYTGVSEGHTCRECGHFLDRKNSAYSIYTEGH